MHAKEYWSSVGISLFLIAMYSIGTISAIMASWTFTLSLLFLSLCIIRYANNTHRINFIASDWILITMVCCFTTIYGASFLCLLFYILCAILLIISSEIDGDSLYRSLKLIKVFGIIFAVGCYWQFLFPGQYFSILYPHFGYDYQQSITRQFAYNKMCTGFTSQTAVSVQFIIMGIMSVLYGNFHKNESYRWTDILELIILTGGLLLTGKRSPILNFSIAYFVVFWITVKRGQRFRRLLQGCAFLCVIVLILLFVVPSNTEFESRNTFVRLMESAAEDSEGGDISNGRFVLAAVALSYFSDNPMSGIGWGKFAELNDITGVHNIYLQLLCECGLFGFIIVVGAMMHMYIKTIKILKDIRLKKAYTLTSITKCSVFIQTYILTYGFFGNPIYDQNYLLMYVFGLLLAFPAIKELRKHKSLKETKKVSFV